MDVISGKRKGTLLYIYDGYSYNRDSRYPYMYRCSLRRTIKCTAVLVEHNGQYLLEQAHDHPKNIYIKEINKMKEEMLRMCRETVMPPKDIFDTVCRNNPAVAVHISYNSMKSILSREKVKLRPPIPHTINELHEQLRNFEPMKHVYKGCVTSDDGASALIFASNKMLEALALSEEVFVDGTFSVVPKIPKFAQLYSVHIRYADTGVAAAFILCGSRTMTLYKAMWKKLLELAPGLQENLKFIMSDYEKAAIVAMNETFPNANIHGCWFHYNQAILRKWRRLKLNSASRELVSMAMTVPLAPHDRFSEAFLLMQHVADSMALEYPAVLQFMAYLRTTWLPIAEKVSVFGCSVRTNNIVESFHNGAARRLGTVFPNLWMFLENLDKLIADQEIDFMRLENGQRARRVRTQFNKDKNNKIEGYQKDLMSGRIPLSQFLRMFIRMNLHQQYQEELLQYDSDAEVEISGDLLCSALNAVPNVNNNNSTVQRNQQRRRRARGITRRVDEAHSSVNQLSHETAEQTLNEDSSLHPRNETNENAIRTNMLIENPQNEENSIFSQVSQDERISNQSLFDSEINDNGDILEVPEDDYGYWLDNQSQNSSTESVPYVKAVTGNLDDTATRVEGECIVCFATKANQVFVPCGHLCCCLNCVKKLASPKCPMCNLLYEKCIRVITC